MAKRTDPRSLLRRLESIRASYGEGLAARKLELLRGLSSRSLASARDVLRLHEALCFLRAYPDDAELLAQVERMLAAFERRSDLRRHADELADSGVAGTAIHFRFYWNTAAWLARRCPDELTLDREEVEDPGRLDRRLTLLQPYAENLALDEADLPLGEWLDRLGGPAESDAVFLVRRIEALPAGPFVREAFWDELDLPFRLAPGPDTPARTRARHPPSPVVFQSGPLHTSRDRFRVALAEPPRSVRPVSVREARALITLARDAMITRERDLDVFIHASDRDVSIADCGDGLQFACYGMLPERRQMLDAVHGFLVLKNGVPVGYVLSASLFGSTEIAYNVFETYRGAEAAHLFGHSVAVVRRLLGADTFVLDPYQLGHGNREGLESGAWWFYYKLGFRPKDAETKRLVAAELARMRRNPRHRSGIATLQDLSAENMFLHLGKHRRDVIGLLSRENVGFHVVRYLAERFGAERELGVRTCSEEVRRLLGVRSQARWSRDERRAWERWAPLVRVLPGVARWPRADRSALVRVVRAKGGRREADFVRLFDGHRRLRAAVMKLSTRDPYARR